MSCDENASFVDFSSNLHSLASFGSGLPLTYFAPSYTLLSSLPNPKMPVVAGPAAGGPAGPSTFDKSMLSCPPYKALQAGEAGEIQSMS